jgi:integrase/recombinase XerD
MLQRAEEYLAARRSLGLCLRIEGRQLLSFARWADRAAPSGPLTVALALEWARASTRATRVGQARRLEVIRPFARWLQAYEPDAEVPATGLLGPAHPRRAPHVFTDEEIRQLLAAAAALSPSDGLRPQTCKVLFALLACTGLRPGEAVRLTCPDVDLETGCLTVRETKFHKSRLVPLHPTAVRALRSYVRVRQRCVPRPSHEAFFLLDGGSPLTLRKAQTAWNRVRRQLGWSARADRRRPRLYDLRHRFACARLLHWHAARVDVNPRLPALATYLGHVKISDTYWYLTGVPELLAVCAARFERFAPRPERGAR